MHRSAFGPASCVGRSGEDALCCWGRCANTIPEDSAVPLCREHHFRAWQTWQCEEVDAFHAASDRRLAEQRCQRAPDERVYFLRFGDRIKIGYTTDLPTRIKSIPHGTWQPARTELSPTSPDDPPDAALARRHLSNVNTAATSAQHDIAASARAQICECTAALCRST